MDIELHKLASVRYTVWKSNYRLEIQLYLPVNDKKKISFLVKVECKIKKLLDCLRDTMDNNNLPVEIINMEHSNTEKVNLEEDALSP